MAPSEGQENRAWDRAAGEPEKAYAHFLKWLGLEDRNLVRAAKPMRLSHARLLELSSVWGWQNRAAAYDQHESRKIVEATARDRHLAARAIAQDIRESAEARLDVPAAERDPAGVQKLATALKAITPALEDPAPTQTLKIDVEGLYTAVRLREQQREEDEEGTAA
jgi:hypothetical protein